MRQTPCWTRTPNDDGGMIRALTDCAPDHSDAARSQLDILVHVKED